ncbi:MAG: tetratricopeptide repeat protein [Ignavibacteriae bacterium]|nr:MAG: tetratricopeptide repeat protein [Ignavibacteriota bacterium]
MLEKSRLEQLIEMLEKDPQDSFTRYALGLEYFSLKMYDDAVRIFEELILDKPDYHATYYQLGKAYEHMGNFDMAKKVYEKGIGVTESQNENHARDELRMALDELL